MRLQAALGCLLLALSLLVGGCGPLRNSGDGPTRDGVEGEAEAAALGFAGLSDPADCTKVATPNALAQLLGVPPELAPAACVDLLEASSGGRSVAEATEVTVDAESARATVDVSAGSTWAGTLDLYLVDDGGHWKVDRITTADVDYRRTLDQFTSATNDEVRDCVANVTTGAIDERELEEGIVRGSALRGLTTIAALCGARIGAADNVPREVVDCAILRGVQRIPMNELLEAIGAAAPNAEQQAIFAREARNCASGATAPEIDLVAMPGVKLPPLGATAGETRSGSSAPAATGNGGRGKAARRPHRKRPSPPPDGGPADAGREPGSAPSVSDYLDCVAGSPGGSGIRRCARRHL